MSDSLGSGRSAPARKARGPFPRWGRRAEAAAPNQDSDLAGARRELAETTAELERERTRRQELEARAEQLAGLLEDEHRLRGEAEATATATARVAAQPQPLSSRQLRRRRRELERALVPRRKLRLRRLVRRRRRREHPG
jgi:hypothetical protein